MNNEVLINRDDLETIDSNMNYLSNNLDNVTANMNQMENRLNQVSNEFSSLQDSIKKTVLDTQRTALVLNAKQTIMLLQNEYDRKYRRRDDIRSRVLGIIQAVDVNKLKRDTIEMISEESIVNNSDYWLTYSLLALSSWYLNDRESADNYLKKALQKDAEATSLLLCLIHLRANRNDTAIRWLNQYLGMQDPTKIDGKIALVFEAITSGIFNKEMQDICLNRFEEWLHVLNNNLEYRTKEVTRWGNEFKTYQTNKRLEEYPYINKFVVEKDIFVDMSNKISSVSGIAEHFKDVMSSILPHKEEFVEKIDELIKRLIFNFDKEERDLANSLAMNEYIIKYDGNIEEATLKYNNDEDFLNSYCDFYKHITNIALSHEKKEYSPNTIKMAMALSKDIIVMAYNNYVSLKENLNNNKFTIKLNDYEGITSNGENEKELIDEVNNMLDKKFYKEIYNPKIIGVWNVLSIVLLCVVIIYGNVIPFLGIVCFIMVVIYNVVTLYKRSKERKKKQEMLLKLKEDYRETLCNVIAEIVDNYFIVIDKINEDEDFVTYVKSLKYTDYFAKTIDNKYRNIITEDN